MQIIVQESNPELRTAVEKTIRGVLQHYGFKAEIQDVRTELIQEEDGPRRYCTGMEMQGWGKRIKSTVQIIGHMD